ncbi:c-type cytochrome [Pseudenhygromyxa sp. WMMC2535]|uniref:c-type cytochrome n=1 Tax=Pseudenhygromyxa sp. WMMC2535 TaxID=2712867 RepID=UPI001555BFE8|nr:c-type cytochrome [Pseudenhygromyxa sp. WMMC2535]NVB40595.1 c-type cytochrome [Pseudenhygromyxa sp. WMMC2535]
MSRILAVTLFAFAGLTTACGGGSKGGGGSDANAEAVAEANKVWTERCVTCHGNSGKGDGPGAAALAVKPRSFSDPNWQASVDDARIKSVIVGGGASVGLNEAMAANPDLEGKDAVLNELVTKIRKLSQ